MTQSRASEVADGLRGALGMAFSMVTPFLRPLRSHWGLSRQLAERSYPGDEYIPSPRWSWTHGIEIQASSDEVWPWLAQIGADRGGFYSYAWLENLAGCQLANADSIRPEWAHQRGSLLRLHPRMPPLTVMELQPGRHFVAFGAPDAEAQAGGRPYSGASWLFFIEPLVGGGCRVISRFRSIYSNDLMTRLTMGPAITEPIGFVMDRRMLLGIKERVEAGRSGTA